MKESIPYIITILLMIIAGGTTYILIDKKENKSEIKKPPMNDKNNVENKDQEKLIDGVKLNKVYSLNNNIIEEYEITLNGKTKNISITFEYKYDSELYDDAYYVSGTFNNLNIYTEETASGTDTKEKVFNLNCIKEKFNETNFQIIKGKDNKSYLLIIAPDIYESYLHILNDNFEVLSNNIVEDNLTGRTGFNITYFYNNPCGIENNSKPWYQNTFGINHDFNNIHIKIEDNKIYFLYPNLKDHFAENDAGILEERVYTINNSKLEYEVIKTYKITSVCQQI